MLLDFIDELINRQPYSITFPAPKALWPTSLFPKSPSGKPTYDPDAYNSLCGLLSIKDLIFGMFAALTALTSAT